MNSHELTLASTPLRKGEILRLRHAQGQRIEALSGSVWITIDGDRRDVVLDARQGFNIDRDGDTLVSALSDARIVVLSALPLPAGNTGAGQAATATGL